MSDIKEMSDSKELPNSRPQGNANEAFMGRGGASMSLSANVQAAYEKQYENHQSLWRETGARQKARNIMEVTRGMAFNKVLEVGAGDGSILKFLSEAGFAKEYYAVEISGSAIQRIRERHIPQLVQVLPFDGYAIPFPDHSFDLVILSHVLEHVEYERKLLRELQRLAPNQVIEVPKDYRFGVDKKVPHFLSYGHINTYTPSSLRFLLRSEGFTVLQQKIGVYSRDTYRQMAAGNAAAGGSVKTWKADALYAAKKWLVSLPAAQIRDYFANTITVLTSAAQENVDIFHTRPAGS